MSKWPKKVKHRNKVLAKIYRPCHGRDSYRVTWYAAGKRQMKSLPSYSGQGGAKEFAEGKVKELASNSQAAMLSPSQATDALAAIERLTGFFQATGHKFSLLASVSEFCEAKAKSNGRSLVEVAEGFSRTVANIKRHDIVKAVEDFAALDNAKTQAPDGQRPEIGEGYAKQKAAMLRKFAAMLPGHAVSDLNKSHVDFFINGLNKLPSKRVKALKPTSPKSRNHHRTALGQFFRWAVRNDYLPLNHRLFEAESMKPEKTNGGETEFYTAKEFGLLLEAANGTMQAIIAIGGLAGLRTAEILRLDWGDVWRVAGHIEVTAAKSKTRQRRLVVVCPALKAWLNPFRQFKTGKLWDDEENRFHEAVIDLCDAAICCKRNRCQLEESSG
jgi:hypothetical protein